MRVTFLVVDNLLLTYALLQSFGMPGMTADVQQDGVMADMALPTMADFEVSDHAPS
jgi:hypothetical protein